MILTYFVPYHFIYVSPTICIFEYYLIVSNFYYIIIYL